MNKEHPHIEVNVLDEKKKKSMLSRVIVGAILAVVGIPSLFFGGWIFFVFISVFLGFAIYEIMRATTKTYRWYVWAFTYFITLSYVYWVLVKYNIGEANAHPETFQFSLEAAYQQPLISWYAMAISLGMYFLFGIADKDFDVRDVAYFFAMTFLVGLGFQCLLFVRYHPIALAIRNGMVLDNTYLWCSSTSFLAFVLLAAFGNDTMAYFVGVFFGKHKMSPRVSPNKSWEGFFGGWILGGALAFGFAALVEGLGTPILPHLAMFSGNYRWWAVALLSFGLPLIGVLGDLALSLVKRYFGVKDYGKLLAAHGGVLDRVDSLIFCCIFASIMVVIFGEGGAFLA